MKAWHPILILLLLGWAGAIPLRAQSTIELSNQQHAAQMKLWALESEKAKALQDLQAGRFCSECGNSATQIEASGTESFAQHLKNVGGKPRAATPEQVSRVIASYNSRISALRREIDGYSRRIQDIQQEAEDKRQREIQASQAKRKADFDQQMQRRKESYQAASASRAKTNDAIMQAGQTLTNSILDGMKKSEAKKQAERMAANRSLLAQGGGVGDDDDGLEEEEEEEEEAEDTAMPTKSRMRGLLEDALGGFSDDDDDGADEGFSLSGGILGGNVAEANRAAAEGAIKANAKAGTMGTKIMDLFMGGMVVLTGDPKKIEEYNRKMDEKAQELEEDADELNEDLQDSAEETLRGKPSSKFYSEMFNGK